MKDKLIDLIEDWDNGDFDTIGSRIKKLTKDDVIDLVELVFNPPEGAPKLLTPARGADFMKIVLMVR